jgi:hypothetical protein
MRVYLSPSALFIEWIDFYAEKRGITRARAVQELAIRGLHSSGVLNEDWTLNEDFDPDTPSRKLVVFIPQHGGKRAGAGRKPTKE